MKAIVRHKYGPPDVLELGDIDEPSSQTTRCFCAFVRLPSSPPTGTSCEASRTSPGSNSGYASRRTGSSVAMWRGESRQSARTSRCSSGAARCSGVRSCTGLARLPSVYVSRKTSWHRNRPTSRSSRRRPYPWPSRRPGPARLPTHRAGAEGIDHRGLWRRGDLRRADRQVLRCRGEWRVQLKERGDGQIARGGPRHRLHPGGLRPKRAQVRSHLPVGGEPFTVRVQARAHLRGEARAEQRRVGGSLDRWPRLSPLEPWS
jgi:hypothetical protein